MTATPDIERLVGQHHNDIAALYKLQKKTSKTVNKIAETQQEHGTRLAHLEETQASHTETLNAHTETLNAHTKTLNAHTKTLDVHTGKLDAILALLRNGRSADGR